MDKLDWIIFATFLKTEDDDETLHQDLESSLLIPIKLYFN